MIAYHHSESPAELQGTELDRRLADGWFRMHEDIFTTSHLFTQDDIYRVHWLRYNLHHLSDRPSLRRLRKLNAPFRVECEDFSGIRADHEELFKKYRASIDFDGADSVAHALFGEAPTGRNIYQTKCLSVFDSDRLIAGGYFDLGERAGTSILHFFDPGYRRSSLGRFMMLRTVDYLLEHGFLFYYPGYVVAGKSKMNYKLFLGRDVATYFDPATGMWLPFDEKILLPERLTEADKLQIVLAFVD
jgi:leucyl-tRNA---protein transferase